MQGQDEGDAGGQGKVYARSMSDECMGVVAWISMGYNARLRAINQ